MCALGIDKPQLFICLLLLEASNSLLAVSSLIKENRSLLGRVGFLRLLVVLTESFLTCSLSRWCSLDLLYTTRFLLQSSNDFLSILVGASLSSALRFPTDFLLITSECLEDDIGSSLSELLMAVGKNEGDSGDESSDRADNESGDLTSKKFSVILFRD